MSEHTRVRVDGHLIAEKMAGLFCPCFQNSSEATHRYLEDLKCSGATLAVLVSLANDFSHYIEKPIDITRRAYTKT